ncbi:GvpL/GvpF family gas vesicle protein [Streptomyces sp. NPDC018031]|uniref:GvpL/GvpF family gas vesicle protein n=1 Tax=Streptomyces sp. NPDC018031 TaxID=3365033 RepID=UPI0037BCD8FF
MSTTGEHRGELRYVYAVAPAHDTPEEALGHLRGIAGGPVRTVRHGGLAALTGPVPAAEFDELPLRERLEDLRWLEEVARAHQRVVDAAARTAPCVVPLRLATVCRDDSGVRRLLDVGRERFTTALHRLAGRVEWGVKMYAAPPHSGSPETVPAASAGVAGAAGPEARRSTGGPEPGRAGLRQGAGRDYLRRRSAERRADEERWRVTRLGAHRVFETLAPYAEAVRRYPPQDTGLSGVAEPNLLNAAFLVDRADGEAFAARVRDLGAGLPGARLELTGPWAPYSFLSGGDEGGAAGDGEGAP